MESRPDLPVLGLAPLPPREVPEPALRPRWGYRLTRALLRAQADDWTGTLEVYAEGASTYIYLRDGRPVFVRGGLPADSLGRVLAQRGWITEHQLSEVVEHRMSIQGRKRFGEVAVELGVLDPAALDAALTQQICDKIMRCLHWEHGDLEMRADDHGLPHREGVRLNVEPLILGAVERHFSAPRIEDLLSPYLHRPVCLRHKLQRVAQRFQLDTDETVTLERSLEAPDLLTFVALRGSGRTKAGALLCALALADQLELPDVPANVGEAGTTDEDAPGNALSDNDQYAGQPRRIMAGGLRLLRPATRPLEHEPSAAEAGRRDKLLADSAFLQGRELLRADEFAAAADAFRTAAALRPGAREYGLHAAWAGYLAAERNERFRARLQAQCRGALSQDRHLAFAHHVLGQLALEEGDLGAARAAFERAVQLDPNDDVALENLARLPR